jgi:hypothetical protein
VAAFESDLEVYSVDEFIQFHKLLKTELGKPVAEPNQYESGHLHVRTNIPIHPSFSLSYFVQKRVLRVWTSNSRPERAFVLPIMQHVSEYLQEGNAGSTGFNAIDEKNDN